MVIREKKIKVQKRIKGGREGERKGSGKAATRIVKRKRFTAASRRRHNIADGQWLSLLTAQNIYHPSIIISSLTPFSYYNAKTVLPQGLPFGSAHNVFLPTSQPFTSILITLAPASLNSAVASALPRSSCYFLDSLVCFTFSDMI